MDKVEQCLDRLFREGAVQNIAIRIGKGEKVIYEMFRSVDENINAETLFDMASVTKILAPTCIALIAMDEGVLHLSDKVGDILGLLPKGGDITVKHLLTHTLGIGHKDLTKSEVTYDNVAEHILSIAPDIPIGSDVLYSCPGFILLGKVLEKIFDKRLDILFYEKVAQPLGMKKSLFCPPKCKGIVNSNINLEECGLVNDCNCRHLGGIAGNAGLFSNINDMTKFVFMLIKNGAPIISAKTFKEAVKNHTVGMSEGRGLGFLYVDGKYSQTGSLFAEGSIGHCGHTGQSVFVSPSSGLYAIILSDTMASVTKKCGFDDYGAVMKIREEIHNAIYEDLQ